MESAGAIEIFRRSVETRGVLYTKYLEDRDSKRFASVVNISRQATVTVAGGQLMQGGKPTEKAGSNRSLEHPNIPCTRRVSANRFVWLGPGVVQPSSKLCNPFNYSAKFNCYWNLPLIPNVLGLLSMNRIAGKENSAPNIPKSVKRSKLMPRTVHVGDHSITATYVSAQIIADGIDATQTG